MTVERLGEPVWNVVLEGTNLQVEGLTLDLEALSGPEPRVIRVYADAAGAPTLTPSGWLGAEVLLPPRPLKAVQVGEVVYGDEGNEQREPVYELRPGPLNWELVRVRLFGLSPAANGGEA